MLFQLNNILHFSHCAHSSTQSDIPRVFDVKLSGVEV